mgnify:CR=1 FL=1
MKIPNPDFKFKGRYYTSGRGIQSVRAWDGKYGRVELTSANVDKSKWFELRVRNHSWSMGKWIGKDYVSKGKAEKGVLIALNEINKKSKCDRLRRDDNTCLKEMDNLRNRLPNIDW